MLYRQEYCLFNHPSYVHDVMLNCLFASYERNDKDESMCVVKSLVMYGSLICAPLL